MRKILILALVLLSHSVQAQQTVSDVTKAVELTTLGVFPEINLGAFRTNLYNFTGGSYSFSNATSISGNTSVEKKSKGKGWTVGFPLFDGTVRVQYGHDNVTVRSKVNSTETSQTSATSMWGMDYAKPLFLQAINNMSRVSTGIDVGYSSGHNNADSVHAKSMYVTLPFAVAAGTGGNVMTAYIAPGWSWGEVNGTGRLPSRDSRVTFVTTGLRVDLQQSTSLFFTARKALLSDYDVASLQNPTRFSVGLDYLFK